MLLIWGIAFIYLVLGHLFQNHFADTHILTFSFIILTMLIFYFVLFMHYTKFIIPLFLGFLVRVGMLLVDLADGGPEIPHSGDDTENFYKVGVLISEKMDLLGESVYGGTYSKLIGVILNIYGDDRLFLQYLNVLFAMTAILVAIQIFRMLDVPARTQFILVAVMAFFPHSLIFSSILLRESIISLMVVLSLYWFVRWFIKKERTGAVLSIVFVLVGAAFHSAVIGILIGYLFGFVFYQHSGRAFKFTVTSVVPFTLFAVLTAYVLIFPGVVSGLPIFNKFEQILNNDDVYDAFTSTRGDTAYLTGLEINNIFQLIVFSPIKIIYFIASPMPWSVRNFSDLISFFLDALFYVFALIVFIRNIDVVKRRPILAIVLLGIAAGWLIFGLGISNAGTALRHRFKLFYLIIIAFALIGSKKKPGPHTIVDDGARPEPQRQNLRSGDVEYAEEDCAGRDVVNERIADRRSGAFHRAERIFGKNRLQQ